MQDMPYLMAPTASRAALVPSLLPGCTLAMQIDPLQRQDDPHWLEEPFQNYRTRMKRR